MRFKDKLLLWILRHQRPAYVKLKGLNGLAVGEDHVFWDLHAQIVMDERGGPSLTERYTLYSLAKATSHLPGALAEAGVYRGGSAKILCTVKGNSPLYLFDTFEGMPRVNAATDGGFAQGDFADTRYEDVAAYLSPFANVHFYKGFFPDSAIGQEPEKQSYRFVHLDMDIYESTLKGLEFFYPRVVSGGVIVSHDYGNVRVPGVKKAFDDFFKDKKETVVPLWNSQCLVAKI